MHKGTFKICKEPDMIMAEVNNYCCPAVARAYKEAKSGPMVSLNYDLVLSREDFRKKSREGAAICGFSLTSFGEVNSL